MEHNDLHGNRKRHLWLRDEVASGRHSHVLERWGTGRLSPASATCTLAADTSYSSKCTVTYQPKGVANTSQTLNATYTPNDNVHATSSTATGFTLSLPPRQGNVAYIGPTLAVTSGSSSTTAQLALSASVTDPNPVGDSVANSTVTFTDVLSGKVLASGVKVSLVSNSDTATGTANTVVTLSTGQYGSQEYLIKVTLVPGDFTNSAQIAGANGRSARTRLIRRVRVRRRLRDDSAYY